jgi:hypothetical protein
MIFLQFTRTSCCNQIASHVANQNNKIIPDLAYTRDYDFFTMHTEVLLQLEGTLCCKLVRQKFPVSIYQIMKFFFAITHEPLVATITATHVCKLAQQKLFSNLPKH